MDDVVVGVLGASGGLGTSSLAVALALLAGDRLGVAAAVDGDLTRGGLDVTACVEHQPGVRWGDLTALDGEVDGPGLLRSLPAERNARFLAAGGALPGEAVVAGVVSALATSTSLVVVDCGTRAEAVGPCTDVVLLCGTSVRHLADGTACAAQLRGSGVRATGLVLRSAGRHPVEPEDVAYHLDLRLIATMRDDGRVAADPGRGRPPGARSADAVSVAADRVLDALGLDPYDVEAVDAEALGPDRAARRDGA